MSQTTGYFQYYTSAERVAKVKGADISTAGAQYPVNFATMKTKGDFVTFKCGGQVRTNFTARYIKVSANGSTSNTASVFNEIKVINGATNWATGSTVTSSQPPTANPLTNFIDGNLSTYTVVGNGPQWIKIDMLAARSIVYIQLQLFYTDGRSFHNKKIEISNDDITYTTIFDSTLSGELPEKLGGMMIFKYNGMATDINCTNANLVAARSAGLKVGFYWFKNPNYLDFTNGWLNTIAQAELEAQQFYNYIVAVTGSSTDMGDIFPVLDFENGSGNIYPSCTNDEAYDFIEAFINKFKQLSNRRIMLYTAFYTIENLASATGLQLYHSVKGGIGALCPLWLAATDSGIYPSYSYTRFGVFTNHLWLNWQFSSDGNGQGSAWGVSSTDIDLNVLETDLYSIMPPTKPTGLVATIGDTQIALNWNPNPDSDMRYYNIYKDGVYLTFIPSTSTTYTVTGLTNGQSYSFNVSAVDIWEIGILSDTVFAIPSLVSVPLSASVVCEAIIEENCGGLLKTIKQGIANAPTEMFEFANKLYILTGSEYLVYDGTTCATVVGYRPLVAIACPPSGGVGTVPGDGLGRLFEQINVLTGSKHQTFSPDGVAADFFILEKSVTSIDFVKKDGVTLTLTTDYTIDLTLGKVHFVVVPITGTPSNIDIGWTKGVGQRVLIENCRFEMDYSGQTDSRVFLWGNTNFKNRRFWSGLANGVPSAEYFEANSYDDLGTGQYAITDIVKHYDRQKIFFELGGGAMFSYYTADTDIVGNTVVSFPSFELNDNISNVAFGQVQVVNNQPYTLNHGVYAWKPSNVRDQTNAVLISQKVRESLDLVDLSTAKTYNWQEQQEYWLNIGSIVWVHNYYNGTWYKYDNIAASYFLVIDGAMYFGTEGAINKFDTSYRNDNGAAINCNWTMGFYDFGADWRLKYINRAWIAINSSYRTSLDIQYITNVDNGVLNELETISFNVLNFNHINFQHFSFDTSYNPQPFAIDIDVQRFIYFKFVLSKSDPSTTVTVLSINMLGRLGGKL